MAEESFYRRLPHEPEIELVSVQSAKGGVGKTLLSFLLANHLLEYDKLARVVVLDLDFSGTEVVDAFPKSANDDINLNGIPVRLFRKDNDAQNDHGMITLLDLFEEYLLGRDLPESLPEKAIRKAWTRDRKRVFHIPSGKTYATERDEHFANVLFDANHALWFVDYLFKLFSHLEQSMRDRIGKGKSAGAKQSIAAAPLFVILDNAPGQSQLLQLLQERMLRSGRHQAKFIQVASLDKMDIQASLTVLARLHDRFETIQRTKKAIAANLKTEPPSKSGWEVVLKELDQGQIDRDLLDEILADGVSTVQDVIENERQIASNARAPQAQNHMALVINRVFDTVDLGSVDTFILKQAKDLESVNQKPTTEFLTHLRREAFPFDPALALFFQEQFLQQKSSQDVTTHAAVEAISRSNSSTEDRQEVTSELLVRLDIEVFQALYASNESGDASFLQRSLIRGVGARDVVHLMRGLDVMGRLLDLSHRIVRACRTSASEIEERGGTFRLEVMRSLEDELDRDTGSWTGRTLLAYLKEVAFVRSCLGERPRQAGPRQALNPSSLEDFHNLTQTASGVRVRDIPPLVRDMLDLSFPMYGVFVAFPSGLDERTGKVKARYEAFFRSVYEVARTVVAAACAHEPPPVLCAALEHQLRSAPSDRPGNVHGFHLEIAGVTEQVWLYDQSLKHGAEASRMLLHVIKVLPKDDLAPTAVTELYVRTALVELFHGLRSDVSQVETEVLNLFRGAGPPRLTRRIEERLGHMLFQLFGNGCADADA